MSSAIKVKELCFNYGTDNILNHINFIIESGSFVSILGPNGSGKTTLLKNICNLLKPHKGYIYIEDKDVKGIKYKDLAKTLGVVHQANNISFDFTVHDVVLMGRFAHQKRFKSETQHDLDVVRNAMKETETWGFRDKSINEISGGERQRVVMARALAQEPKILLLDEPISQLDIKHQINILSLCKRLNKQKNITIVTTLHDINLAGEYSDYILLLDNGNIRALDVPEKVLTSENIESVYGIKVKLFNKPANRVPYIVPQVV